MNSNIESEADFIRIDFNHKDMRDVVISAKENKYVSKDAKIGEYKIETGKRSIFSPIYGKIVKIDMDDKYIIMEHCNHEALYGSLCLSCNIDLKYIQITDYFISYIYIHFINILGRQGQHPKPPTPITLKVISQCLQ
jgi:hypothetical protein